MSAQSATIAGRVAAEANMFDTCIVTRGGTATWDEAAGTWTTGSASTVYSGKCKLQTENVQVTNPDVASTKGVLVAWRLDLPVDGSGDVRTNDTVTMTACQLDGEVVGKTFTVNGPHMGTAKTARRLPVKAEVSSWT